MLNERSDFVLVVCSKPVAALWILTSALWTTAPEESVTVPLMEPRVCCACTGAPSRQRRTRQNIPSQDIFCIYVHPFPQVTTRPLRRIYHTSGAKIECCLVDNPGRPVQVRDYDEQMNGKEIAHYNPQHTLIKLIRARPQT